MSANEKKLSSHLELRVTLKVIMKARLCKVCIRREIKAVILELWQFFKKCILSVLMGQITCASEFDRNKGSLSLGLILAVDEWHLRRKALRQAKDGCPQGI